MTRSRLLLLLAIPLTACPSLEGELNTEGVGIARYGEAYNAQVGVVGYAGPARYEVTAGALPEGLTMDAAGRILGTPAWAGVQTVDVTVTGLRNIDDFTGPLSIDVRFDHLEGVALGVERAWLNNFFHDPPIGVRDWSGIRWSGQGPDDTGMYDPWTRLAGTGIADQSTIELDFGIYLPGANARGDGGGMDDVRIGDVHPSELTTVLEDFAPVADVDPDFDSGYPSGHYAEGDDAVYDADTGVFTAGADTGTLRASFTHPDVDEPLALRLQVSAPDWCPDPGC